MECMTILAAGVVRNFLIQPIRWIGKKADMHRDATWGFRITCSSMTTPRFLVVKAGAISSRPMVIFGLLGCVLNFECMNKNSCLTIVAFEVVVWHPPTDIIDSGLQLGKSSAG